MKVMQFVNIIFFFLLIIFRIKKKKKANPICYGSLLRGRYHNIYFIDLQYWIGNLMRMVFILFSTFYFAGLYHDSVLCEIAGAIL